jgi:hypothetical protein
MTNQDYDVVEFTLDQIKSYNFFEPQKALADINDELRKKIATVVERIEDFYRKKYCSHRQQHLEYSKVVDTVLCLECDREFV